MVPENSNEFYFITEQTPEYVDVSFRKSARPGSPGPCLSINLSVAAIDAQWWSDADDHESLFVNQWTLSYAHEECARVVSDPATPIRALCVYPWRNATTRGHLRVYASNVPTQCAFGLESSSLPSLRPSATPMATTDRDVGRIMMILILPLLICLCLSIFCNRR